MEFWDARCFRCHKQIGISYNEPAPPLLLCNFCSKPEERKMRRERSGVLLEAMASPSDYVWPVLPHDHPDREHLALGKRIKEATRWWGYNRF